MLFKKNEPVQISEFELQKQALFNLENESSTYKAFVRQTIEDLRETNSAALAEKEKTEILIEGLVKVQNDFTDLIESNNRTIAELEKIFVVETEE